MNVPQFGSARASIEYPQDATPMTSELAEVLAAATDLLCRRTGTAVTLTDPELLAGAGPTVVLRVRVGNPRHTLPRTVVIKKVPERQKAMLTEAFRREVVSYQFSNSLRSEVRPGAELLAHDPAAQVLVMTDLGSGPTVAQMLAMVADGGPGSAGGGAGGGTDSEVHHTLMAWAQALGRMHTATAGREADFDALLRRSGVTPSASRLSGAAHAAIGALPGMLASLGVPTPALALAEVHAAGEAISGPEFRAFSPFDLCPDNSMITDGGVRFLDFEWGGFADVAVDIASLVLPFPGCLCLPGGLAGHGEAMVHAWREEVLGLWPRLADDAVLWARVADAATVGVWLSTYWYLPGMAHRRVPESGHLLRRSATEVLAVRWSYLAELAERTSREGTAAHAREVAASLGQLRSVF